MEVLKKPSEAKVLKVAKYKCLNSLLFFTRYFFKQRFSRKFVVGDHHVLICEVLEKVLRGEITKLIINIAPRYGKTEVAVKNFIAHGLALNPSAKFIHLTYADTLALDNSEDAKDLVTSEEYQQMFPNVQIKKDSKAKNKWYTTEGGGVYAAAAGGQVTGFGAGEVEDPDLLELDKELQEISNLAAKGRFAGGIIIDDPIKPEDGNSTLKRERVNTRFETTIRSRVNSRNTPIIIIGQRIHKHDLSGYLIDTEPGEWTVLSLPALADGKPLWEFKHTVEELEKLRKINEFVFETQYQQNPKPLVGLVFNNWEAVPYDQLPHDKPFIGGLDFGYTNDPTAGVKVWLDSAAKTIHVQELCYSPGIPPIQMSQIFKSYNFNSNTTVYCEHDPDQVAQLQHLKFARCIPARKGPGSIFSGILKLQEYKVFYHGDNIAFEVENYSWDIDPETGKPINKPIDNFNHLMDAIRYAVYSHFYRQ